MISGLFLVKIFVQSAIMRINPDCTLTGGKREILSMFIPVIYFDNFPGKVNSEDLDEMIRRRLIIAFRRSNGWVKVSGCHYRGLDGTYKAPNRRENKDCS